MQHENIFSLMEQLRYLGFGEEPNLDNQLTELVDANEKEFKLCRSIEFDQEKRLEVVLHFRWNESLKEYAIVKYDAGLKYVDQPEKKLSTSFYIYHGMGVSAREAFNLLEGRSVFKGFIAPNGEKNYAWMKLNFLETDSKGDYKVMYFREAYRYDLEKALAPYHILEMEDVALRQNLLVSLKKGNKHLVTFITSYRKEKKYIQANPVRKSIIISPTRH